jgi:hypothetical protein
MPATRRSLENYKFAINPIRSGTFMGTLSFVTSDGNYLWFAIEVGGKRDGRWSQGAEA